jgi:hypothetical protein
MDNVVGIVFIAAFAAQFVGTVIYLVQVGRLLRRLESKHQAVHESLGSPLLIFNNRPRNNMLVLGWLWRREFESLDDAGTIALARNVRTMLLCLAVGFGIVLLLFFVLQASFGSRVAT